jgi:hypothetical protein
VVIGGGAAVLSRPGAEQLLRARDDNMRASKGDRIVLLQGHLRDGVACNISWNRLAAFVARPRTFTDVFLGNEEDLAAYLRPIHQRAAVVLQATMRACAVYRRSPKYQRRQWQLHARGLVRARRELHNRALGRALCISKRLAVRHAVLHLGLRIRPHLLDILMQFELEVEDGSYRSFQSHNFAKSFHGMMKQIMVIGLVLFPDPAQYHRHFKAFVDRLHRSPCAPGMPTCPHSAYEPPWLVQRPTKPEDLMWVRSWCHMTVREDSVMGPPVARKLSPYAQRAAGMYLATSEARVDHGARVAIDRGTIVMVTLVVVGVAVAAVIHTWPRYF